MPADCLLLLESNHQDNITWKTCIRTIDLFSSHSLQLGVVSEILPQRSMMIYPRETSLRCTRCLLTDVPSLNEVEKQTKKKSNSDRANLQKLVLIDWARLIAIQLHKTFLQSLNLFSRDFATRSTPSEGKWMDGFFFDMNNLPRDEVSRCLTYN